VALTFDDGPSTYTEQVLHILDDKHITGTFFEIGTQTGGAGGVMRKIIAHGHEIGNHSYRHETLPSRSSMEATNHLIENATGFEPCHFRPPGGAYNSGTISSARSLGMGTVNWSIDTRDWDGPPSAGTILSRATGGGPGTIVLMHDGGGPRGNTVAALPGIIDSYRKRGYKMVTLTELLGGHFKLREMH
jgi:peptidoglycan/xylan/chitin deacetylase (PgdA/CDA1 family)